jgi:F0F1-type ATP synthase membrane subunit b/b'
MSVLGIIATTGHFVSEEFGIDADGNVTTHHWLLPETAEIIYGGLASLIIFGALWKFGGPMIKKSFAARTEKIQKELDAAAADKAAAATEAAGIRTAKGDIAAERQRLLAEAESQAAAVLEDGRARLAVEVAEVEAKAASTSSARRAVSATNCGRRSLACRRLLSTMSSRVRSTTPRSRN